MPSTHMFLLHFHLIGFKEFNQYYDTLICFSSRYVTSMFGNTGNQLTFVYSSVWWAYKNKYAISQMKAIKRLNTANQFYTTKCCVQHHKWYKYDDFKICYKPLAKTNLPCHYYQTWEKNAEHLPVSGNVNRYELFIRFINRIAEWLERNIIWSEPHVNSRKFFETSKDNAEKKSEKTKAFAQ